MATTSVVSKAPRLGRKQIFLPNFTLTLLRTPDLPPTFACFKVPLKLNKLDIRDYLWNCYGVSVLSVRSFIQIHRDIRRGRKTGPITKTKKMTVELDKPFVWPAEPTDFDMWDKKVYDSMNEEREQRSRLFNDDKSKLIIEGSRSIGKQAKELLRDPKAWKTGNSNTWGNASKEIEVETSLQIPKSEGS